MRKLTNAELKAENALGMLQPMTNPGTARESPPDIITRGEGSWIWDVDGHRLIDGVGGCGARTSASAARKSAMPSSHSSTSCLSTTPSAARRTRALSSCRSGWCA
jgi:adenosylmethionine-8-amino-7-oxononanoate aminotransferase